MRTRSSATSRDRETAASAVSKATVSTQESEESTTWARYQSLLLRHPHAMQLTQAVILAITGNLVNQCIIAQRDLNIALVVEQVTVNILISPITIFWFQAIQRYKLQWVLSSLLDQLVFNVTLNAMVWYFVAAFFRGGLTYGPGVRVTVHPDAFPSLLAYEPVWATRVRGLQLKLPTTLVREKVVPVHLKGVFELLVRLVWSVIVAAKLAAWQQS